jgi:uncharacterized membrane protein YfcA
VSAGPLLLYALPLKVRFPRSRLYISVIPPILLGVFVGVLSAVMGVGGGFILVPAMVYLLRMPARWSSAPACSRSSSPPALTSVLQAGRNQTVDIVLATLLLLGGVIGAQLGARASGRFRAEELRALLALLVLVVGLRMGAGLFLKPDEAFVLMAGAVD